jgi:hypothetical protein
MTMNDRVMSTAAVPWYRQFWPWVLIAIPAWGILSSLITVSVALYGADEVITENDGRALSKTSWMSDPPRPLDMPDDE